MSGPIVRFPSGRPAPLLALMACLTLPFPSQAQTESDTGELRDDLLRWDLLANTVKRGWSDVATIVATLPMPDMPSVPAILSTRRGCFGPVGTASSDCSASVQAICREHGFASVTSIATESGEICRLATDRSPASVGAFACKSKVWLTRVACW